MLHAVIFDLDDTLYPERSYVLSGFQAVASWGEKKLGIPCVTSLQELEQLLDQGKRGNIFNLWMSVHGQDADCLVTEAVSVYRDHHPKIAPYPGVNPLLNTLSNSYRLGLLTDGLVSVQKGKLNALGLEHHFDAMVFSDELGLRARKPSTEPFARMLELLEVKAGEAVYVGENPLKDFFGARQIGLHTVRVLGPPGFYTHHQPPSIDHAAHVEIADLGSLECALRGLRQ